jgi:hypothetical protein
MDLHKHYCSGKRLAKEARDCLSAGRATVVHVRPLVFQSVNGRKPASHQLVDATLIHDR